MSEFLKLWDKAIEKARESGSCVTLYKQSHMLSESRPIARTMHPSFMAPPAPKYDPERDQ